METDSAHQQTPNHSVTSWESWLDAQAEIFFLYARQQTRSEADASDILQEALTETWTKSDGAIPDNAYVFSTIRRRAIDLGRSLTRRSTREELYSGKDNSWYEPDFSSSETKEHLKQAVEKLPEKLSEVLILKIWGEMTFPQISELVGASVPTVTSRYRYALEHLKGNEQLAELKK